MSWISKIKDPMQMQGTLRRPHFFEGWYYRMISPTGECLSLIPGYSTSSPDAHCFLQYILTDVQGDGQTVLRTGYHRFSIRKFHSESDPFLVQVGENRFLRDGIELQQDTPEISLQGKVSFSNLTPIQKSLLSPNIMGWFAYLPWMECNHGVISMGHQLEGCIVLDGRTIDFTGGKGYMEKDWGTSFPKRYVWIQCNQFQSDHTSLMCSIAEIPFLGARFQGHIINLVIKDREIRLATYNQSKITRMKPQKNEVTIEIDHPHWRLKISARLEQEEALKAPQSGQMSRTIKEGLQGTVALELLDKGSDAIIRDEGINAGIELVGYY